MLLIMGSGAVSRNDVYDIAKQRHLPTPYYRHGHGQKWIAYFNDFILLKQHIHPGLGKSINIGLLNTQPGS